MAIHKTAYDTAACNGFQTKKTLDQLLMAAADGWLQQVEGTNVRLLEGGSSQADAVPAFAHPMAYEHHGQTLLAVDVRAFGSWNKDQHKFVTRNGVEYKVATHRGHLNDIWLHMNPVMLRDISQLPLAIFASWVSENVAKRYALDPNEQYKLMIYSAIFYLSNFMVGFPSDRIEDQEKARMAAAIAKACRVSAKEVLDVLDEDTSMAPGKGCPVIANAIQFCNIASDISIRMKEFNVGVLFAILGGTWFGANAKEVVAVALEHPPTWLAILVAAFNERTYKHSGITRLTERKANHQAGQDFVRAVLNLLTTHTAGLSGHQEPSVAPAVY